MTSLTYEDAEKIALQAIHDTDGRGMIGRGRNHLHQRVARALLSAARQARTQGPGEGWEVLADELRKPQFMTTTSGGRKHTLEFTFHGEEGREARDRLHDAILLAAAPPASLIKEG